MGWFRNKLPGDYADREEPQADENSARNMPTAVLDGRAVVHDICLFFQPREFQNQFVEPGPARSSNNSR